MNNRMKELEGFEWTDRLICVWLSNDWGKRLFHSKVLLNYGGEEFDPRLTKAASTYLERQPFLSCGGITEDFFKQFPSLRPAGFNINEDCPDLKSLDACNAGFDDQRTRRRRVAIRLLEVAIVDLVLHSTHG